MPCLRRADQFGAWSRQAVEIERLEQEPLSSVPAETGLNFVKNPSAGGDNHHRDAPTNRLIAKAHKQFPASMDTAHQIGGEQ